MLLKFKKCWNGNIVYDIFFCRISHSKDYILFINVVYYYVGVILIGCDKGYHIL